MADKSTLYKLEHDPRWLEQSIKRWERALRGYQADVSHAHKMIDLRRVQLTERRKAPLPVPNSKDARAVVRLAQSFILAREEPPGSNSGPIINSFTAWGHIPHQPWCGAFAGYCLDHGAGVKVPTAVAVYAPSFRRYITGHENGWLNVPLAEARPGDILLYGFGDYTHTDHVGIMAEVDDNRFETIEGNTHDDLGGGVYRRTDRDGTHVKDVVCVGRPPYGR